MSKRIYLSGLVCAIAIGLVGWLIFDGSTVSEPPITAAKLEPDKKNTNSETLPAKKSVVTTKVNDLTDTHEQSKKVLKVVVPQEKLSKLYIVKCSACHGRDGKGPVGPSIAGKDNNENLILLRKYRTGEVENTMMADLLTRTSDGELVSLSQEISQFK